MRREDLANVLRAAAKATGRIHLLVVGSQAILGHYDDSELPAEATASTEVDLIVEDDKGRDAWESINGTVGEFSEFHIAHGVYAEGVSIETVVLPKGWASRLKSWKLQSSHPAVPRFPSPEDTAASKLVRGDLRDMQFVAALVRHGNLLIEDVERAVEELPLEESHLNVVRTRVRTMRASSVNATE